MTNQTKGKGSGIAPGSMGMITTCMNTCPIISGLGSISYALGDFCTCPSAGVSFETPVGEVSVGTRPYPSAGVSVETPVGGISVGTRPYYR